MTSLPISSFFLHALRALRMQRNFLKKAVKFESKAIDLINRYFQTQSKFGKEQKRCQLIIVIHRVHIASAVLSHRPQWRGHVRNVKRYKKRKQQNIRTAKVNAHTYFRRPWTIFHDVICTLGWSYSAR